ncbi:NADH-quinone oxidoreductase subunit L [Stieleria maiorica]|uniref:Probable inorganic carbon transporter subunit DabB n=1 Tax=Stieleria maiorica TaxID=2795974 RepID=A0A5B9M7M3_9BACT|nr:proton-conducting transporter membrane subunit [Stieleria maiorica]QEF96040.1 NADH-quinone oxidoreductase subunit L [Stieleria maiorica]
MALTIVMIAALPAVMLLALAAAVPRRVADAAAPQLRRWVTAIATLQLGIAVTLTIGVALRTVLGEAAPTAVQAAFPVAVGSSLPIHLDGVSSLMWLMVSFIGWVICRYSIRYLDGDPSQGNYFRWTGLTLAAVSLMVLSGHLLLFYVAWLMTSFGLHHLLLHDPTRRAAQRAAWTKFTIIRIGDVSLAIAFLMIYGEFGTARLGEIFAEIEETAAAGVRLQVASLLLVVAASIKSAQFPFHIWLPQTLDTPTPVSALMHAGIVNAGGYLIIRTSPIVSTAPWTLAVLAIFGTVTAAYAAIVMMTQTSVKKSLAYSTIAQMGFMMMQCGLGAFSAALLHVLAHSMYKAHAFLASGNVITERSRAGALAMPKTIADGPKLEAPKRRVTWIAAAALSLSALTGASLILGLDPSTKPGGFVLGAVVFLAITQWLEKVFSSGDRPLVVRSITTAGVLYLLYAASYRVVDGLAAGSVPVASFSTLQWSVIGLAVGCGFAGLLAMDQATSRRDGPVRFGRWFVHASNGFYVESTLRRVFGSLASS